MIRTFIALEINETLRKQCDYLVQKGKKIFAREVKWVEAKNLHVTYLFLGDIEQTTIKTIQSLLACLAETISPISIDQGELRWFPILKPQLLWIEYPFHDPFFLETRQLFCRQLQMHIPSLKIEQKAFKLHITLGRIKKKIVTEKWQVQNEIFASTLQINQLSLYQSILRPEGPTYKNLGIMELNKVINSQ